MTYLAATVVLLAAVVLLQLWVTLDQSRRIEALQQGIDRLEARFDAGPGDAGLPGMHPVGLPVAEFDAVTVDGEALTREDLTGWTLVAAVSPDCPPCQERLPEFLSVASVVPGGRDQVLALVMEDGGLPPTLVAQLQEVARVVAVRPDSAVFGALGLQYLPTFQWISPERVVELAGPTVDLGVVAHLLTPPVGAPA